MRRRVVGLMLLAMLVALLTGVVQTSAEAKGGAVGPHRFATAKAKGQSATCTYVGKKLTKVSVAPPSAAMRPYWHQRRWPAQPVRFSATLLGLQGGTWVSLHTLENSPAPNIGPAMKRMPALTAFTRSRGIRAGYTDFRVRESLTWYKPAAPGHRMPAEGTAQVTLAHYRHGSSWAGSCKASLGSTGPKPSTGGARLRGYSAGSVVTLTWPASLNLTGAKVCRNVGYSAPNKPTCISLTHVERGTNKLFDTSVQPGTSYSYTIFPSKGALLQVSVRPGVVGGSGTPAVGAGFACSVPNRVECWGRNDQGQLGDGTRSNSSTPVLVSGIAGAKSVAAGATEACAVVTDGSVSCWGDQASAQPVAGVASATSVVAGASHFCALLTGGSVSCWGDNTYGQLGAGNTSTITGPVAVSGLSGVVALAAGGNHTCALLSGGSVRCWGYNGDGELGDGTTTTRTRPTAVSGLGKARAIAAGQGHTCAVLSSGGVRCWGANDRGQLGDGALTAATMPATVSGVAGAVSVAAGAAHSCAVLTNGTVRCWGAAAAVGGSPVKVRGSASASAAVTVPGISMAGTIAAGDGDTCVALADAEAVACWGADDYGQLGTGE